MGFRQEKEQEGHPGERGSVSDSLIFFIRIWYCFYSMLIHIFFCLKIKSRASLMAHW